MLVNCPHCNISFDAPEKKVADINFLCDFCQIPAEYEGWYSGEVKGGMTLKRVCAHHLRYLNGGVEIESGLTPLAADGLCPHEKWAFINGSYHCFQCGDDFTPAAKA